ncbi:MAG: hypothetical protein QW416_01400 [Candidatus Nitrosocaldaceae archaeon]
MIVRCERCGSWIASNNTSFIKEHQCDLKIRSITAKHVSWCIIKINDIILKAAVEPNNRGKFRILWTEKEYKHLINRYIDASYIMQIIINDPPDYCHDDFTMD